MSSHSVTSMDTNSSKESGTSKPTDLYPKHINHAFMPTPGFDGYGRDAEQ